MRASVAEKAAAIIASMYAAEIGDIAAGFMTVEDTSGRKYRVKGIHPRYLIGLVANELYKRLATIKSPRVPRRRRAR